KTVILACNQTAHLPRLRRKSFSHGKSHFVEPFQPYLQSSAIYSGKKFGKDTFHMKMKNRIRGFVLVSAAAVTPLFSLALVALSLFGEAAWSPSHSKTLTFAERVKYQRAIEEVYWHHRIWPKQNSKLKPSLDAVLSQADIEKKVEDYLRNSQL